MSAADIRDLSLNPVLVMSAFSIAEYGFLFLDCSVVSSLISYNSFVWKIRTWLNVFSQVRTNLDPPSFLFLI